MFGHRATTFTVLSRLEFEDRIRFISNLAIPNSGRACIHIECHGDGNGLCIGADFLTWDDLATALLPVMTKKKFSGILYLVLCACSARQQELGFALRLMHRAADHELTLPECIFIYDEDRVPIPDSLLSWAILYHGLSKRFMTVPTLITGLLTRMKVANLGKLIFLLWDHKANKYRQSFPSKPKKPETGKSS